MRTALLILFLSFLYCLSFAQTPEYSLTSSVKRPNIVGVSNLVKDKYDNIYGFRNNKIFKIKDGEILLEFEVNKADYLDSYNILGIPSSLAVDDQLNIYVLNGTKRRIEKHAPDGKQINTFQLKDPSNNIQLPISGFTINQNYEFVTFDETKRKLYTFDTEGNYLKTIDIPSVDTEHRSGSPLIEIDNAGKIYVIENKFRADGYFYNVLQILDQHGNLIRKVGDEDNGIDLPIAAGDMAIDSKGYIYFSNAISNIEVLSPDGEWVTRFNIGNIEDPITRRSRPRLLIDSEDNLYVSGGSDTYQPILKYNSNHVLVEQWGKVRTTHDIAFDNQNNLYFIDYQKYNIIKIDSKGNSDPAFNNNNSGFFHPLAITVDAKGFVYVLDKEGNTAHIRKFDQTGKHVRYYNNISYQFTNKYASAGIAVDADGNMYVSIYSANAVNKYDKDGKLIGQFGNNVSAPWKLSNPKDLSLDALGNIYILDSGGQRIQKFTSTGQFLYQYDNKSTYYVLGSLSSDMYGNTCAITLGHYAYEQKVKLFDIKGKLIDTLPNMAQTVALNNDSRFLATYNEHDVINIFTTSHTYQYNIVQGKIYHDTDKNCLWQNGEAGLSNIIVKAEPGPYYGITDALGNYSIFTEKGVYKIEPITDAALENKPGRQFNKICYTGQNEAVIAFEGYGNYSSGNDFGADVTLSPYLTTSVSSSRRRRCFESTTKVTYANTGFAAAENAKVYLQLPKEVELLSADKTFTRLPNGTYVFDVGTLTAGQIGTITIQDKVVCGDESIRGLTVCTKAWISTAVESKCPVVTTTAKCNTATGEVRVVIKNTGPEDMQVGELFRIYRNGQLTTVESYKLAAGDSLILWIPASGKTIRLEADQPDCNISNTLASVTIEGCKVTTDPAPVSTGFVNALPPDEEEPEVAEECLLITDSYDPNDKQVTPTGMTQENYTPTNTALTYKVRFQNTGTDVAYRVVVTDTLSEHLDISTLQLGAASHTYRYEVSGKGRPVLTWTFDNIMLPDSTTNEPGSHGYIQFSLKPKTDLPEKTAVENFADIFFDFNSPVRTNTTINRIYDMPEEIAETDRLDATTLIATPVLEGFSPASGKLGTEVILTGKKFSAVAANNKVLFNGVQATVLAASENELKVQVPANATSGNIKVKTLDGIANSATGFEVYQPPVVSGFMPAEGIAGTTVTLQGNHLTEAWLQSIKLGGVTCDIISISGTGVIIKVPAGANTDTFEVLSKGGQAQSVSRFIVWHQPAISNLSTVLDKVGATVLITGSNFAPEANRNIVWFGAAKAQVLQATTTTLKVKVPAGATSGIITLETPGGTAQSPAIFEVIPAPQVFTFKPAAGSVGSEVELTGAHFLTFGKQDTIMFNGQKAVVLEASPDQFKVRVPRGATSGKITVAGIGGQAVTASEFKVEELSPQEAIEVYPNPTNGNFTIRFAHADFEIQEIQLFSTLGTLVYSEKVSSPRPEQLDVKLTTPKSGIYILHIKTERGLVIKKLHIL